MVSKGIWIPIELINENVSWTKRILIAEISQLEMLDKGCIASNSHFAKKLMLSNQAVSKALNELAKDGYIAICNAQTKRNFGRTITINSSKSAINSSKSAIHESGESKESNTINNSVNNIIPKGDDDFSKEVNCVPSQEEDLEHHRKEDIDMEKIAKKNRLLVAMNVARHLGESIETSMEKEKMPSEARLNSWSIEIERLMRLDNNEPEDIIKVIDWIHAGKGSFWIPNIKSGKKLRDKFPDLWYQMSQDAPKPVSAKKRILSEVGLGKVFFDYPDKDLDARVSVCLYGEYSALYDFFRNKYIDKDKAVKVWAYIDEHVNDILTRYRSKQN